MTHPLFTLLTAILLSIGDGDAGARTARERLYFAARVFLCCAMTTAAGSWLMRLDSRA